MKRYTGRCPYDKAHARLAKNLNSLSNNSFNFPLHHPFVSDWPSDDELKDAVLSQNHEKFFKMFDQYKRLTPHLKIREILKMFRRSRQKHNCWPVDTLGITTDFMAPLPIGRGQNQTSDQDMNMTNMAVFGVVVTYRDASMSKPANIYFDVTSPNHDKHTYAHNFLLQKVLESPEFQSLLEGRTKVEFYNDTASGYASKENLYTMFKIFPTVLPNIEQISYFPFCSRHGKSDCDRHFQKVKIWCSHFEHRSQLATPDDVRNAILQGSRNSNLCRVHLGKEPIQCYVFHHVLTFPTRRKHQLNLRGLRSTNAITWQRRTDKIINHILPTNDCTVGPEVNKVVISDYPSNLISPLYKELQIEEEPNIGTIDGRVRQREKWIKKFPSLRF
jgi:hypothetical protein